QKHVLAHNAESYKTSRLAPIVPPALPRSFCCCRHHRRLTEPRCWPRGNFLFSLVSPLKLKRHRAREHMHIAMGFYSFIGDGAALITCVVEIKFFFIHVLILVAHIKAHREG